MAIRINTQETFVPIEFGDLEFQFPLDDEALNKIRFTKDEFEEKAAALDKKKEAGEISDEQEFEETKKFVADAYDHMLGDGAFDKIYKQTPNLAFVTKYFMELSEQLVEELKSRGFDDDQVAKMQKYLKESKKK